MNRYHHESHYTVEEIKDELKTKTISMIAREHGVSASAVSIFMKNHGIFLKKYSNNDTRMTSVKVAEKLCISTSMLYRIFRICFPYEPKFKGATNFSRVYTDEQIEKISEEVKRRRNKTYNIQTREKKQEPIESKNERIKDYDSFFDFDPIPKCLKDDD